MLASQVAQAQSETLSTPCGTVIGMSEVAIKFADPFLTGSLTLYDRDGVAVVPDRVFGQPNTSGAVTIPITRRDAGGCDAFIGFDPDGQNETAGRSIEYGNPANPLTIEFQYGVAGFATQVTRFVYNNGDLQDGGFFTPNGVGNVDFFARIEQNRIRISPDDLWPEGAPYMDEFAPDGNWVLPYHLPAICSQIGCFDTPTEPRNPFLMPVSQTLVWGQPLTQPLTPHLPMILPATTTGPMPTYNWMESWLALAFGVGTRLDVSSASFNASGMTFTASSTAQGWLGLRYNPGSGGTLSGDLLVERVAGECPPSTCFTSGISAAITVEGAAPTFDGVRIEAPVAGTYLHGLRVMGPNASPLVTGLRIRDMAGSAVYAHAGATPVLRGEDVNLTLNQESAVYAASTGTHVRLAAAPVGSVLRGPQITNGLGGGVQATTLAQVSFSGGSGELGFANITDNNGRGISASGDADIFAGTTVVQSRNRVVGNAPANGTGNGRASGTGTTVSARCNWWGTADPAGFRVGAVSGATFNANRWLIGDPYNDANVPCVNASGAAARTGYAALGTTTAGDSPTSAGTGSAGFDGGASPADRLADAMEMPPAEQLAALAALVADHPATPEAASALSTAGSLATAGGTPAAVAAEAVALLDAHATGANGDLRRAALGALVGVRLAASDAAGVLDAAGALVAMSGGAARTGHAARVFVHGADDTTASLAALTALDTGWPGSDEADAARAYLAALGVSVPAGRVAPGGQETLEEMSTEASAVVSGTSPTTLAVYPNPSVAGAVVTLTLLEAASVRVAVYDLVGREVVALLSGETAAGSHTATVPADLAPGAYVVRAVASGGAVMATARLVVVR